MNISEPNLCTYSYSAATSKVHLCTVVHYDSPQPWNLISCWLIIGWKHATKFWTWCFWHVHVPWCPLSVSTFSANSKASCLMLTWVNSTRVCCCRWKYCWSFAPSIRSHNIGFGAACKMPSCADFTRCILRTCSTTSLSRKARCHWQSSCRLKGTSFSWYQQNPQVKGPTPLFGVLKPVSLSTAKPSDLIQTHALFMRPWTCP